MPSLSILANFILFQLAWFAGILAPLGWAAGVVLSILLIHLFCIAQAREWRLLLLVMGLGGVWDTLMSALGIFIFNPQTTFWTAEIIPLWLLLLWGNLATTLRHSLQWLERYRIAATVSGAVFAPLAYLGGAAMTDKLSIGVSPPVFIAISAPFWAIFFAFLPQWARRIVAQTKQS